MPEKSIRFGINDGVGNRATTWKCWAPVGVDKHDVYLACRGLGGALKASLHQSGRWHIAYSDSFFKENVDDPTHQERGRFIDKWPRPNEIAPGVTLAYRIVTPCSAVKTPYNQSNFKDIIWIPNANKGKATEIDIIITDSSTSVLGWPGKRSMNNQLLDYIQLDSGETLWIVYMEVEMPSMPNKKIAPIYYKGKSKEDLQSENMRMILFGSEEDGSRVMYDFAIEVKKNRDRAQP
jgi:hypothetical protein